MNDLRPPRLKCREPENMDREYLDELTKGKEPGKVRIVLE